MSLWQHYDKVITRMQLDICRLIEEKAEIEELERLKIENIKLSEQLNYYNMAFRGRQELSLAAWTQKTIKELQDQLQAAQAFAAYLQEVIADKELLVEQERKRVARECIDYVDNHASDCGCSKRIAHDIRSRYGIN